MPEKVLLIHGIAMRSEEKVARYAQTLNTLVGEKYELVPVYWATWAQTTRTLAR